MDVSWYESLWATIIGNAIWRIIVYIVAGGIPMALGWLIGWATHRKAMYDLKKRIAQLEGGDGEQPPTTVDWIDATAIVRHYIEPALVGLRPGVELSVIHGMLERFGEITGAKVGDHEYNRALLHEWIQTNAAKFLGQTSRRDAHGCKMAVEPSPSDFDGSEKMSSTSCEMRL